MPTPSHIKLQMQRIANAAIAGSPPTEYDLQTYSLCRKLNRSHDNLIIILAQINGNFPDFIKYIGFSSTNKQRLYEIDNHYWYVMCLWIHYFQKEYARVLMDTDLSLPDKQRVMENIAKALGFPTEFLTLFVENKEAIKEYLNAIRSDMGAMAEIKLAQLIAAGDPATIRWVLPRLMPQEYGGKIVDESATITGIEIIEVNGQDTNYSSETIY